jgi:hypothetical protein
MTASLLLLLTLTAGPAALALAAELKLHHADIHARLGVRIYVQVGGVAADISMRAVLTNDRGYERDIVAKQGPLGKEEVFTLILRDLPAAKYTLTVSLSDGRQATRTWDKPYDGVPKVGVDENNAVCVDGKPFFPVAPWFIGREADIVEWRDYVNTLNGVGFISSRYSIAGWKEFLDLCQKHGKMAIGPGRGDYWPHGSGTGTCYYTENGERKKDRAAKLDRIAAYVEATKDHPALLFWHWKDEPELDSSRNCIPAAEARRWTEKCHELDPHHPVFLNTGGGKFARPVGNWGYNHIRTYTYLHNDIQPPRNVLLADVISQDYYPIENQNDPNYKITIENMCLAMDRMRKWNYNLPPLCSCVETCDIRKPDIGPPTPAELRLLCWANIVHGARAIVWFHHFNPTPPENFREMARFLDQVTRLTPAVCGAPYTGAITKKELGGGRVDIMANTHSGALYVFAVNLKRTEENVVLTLDKAPRTIDVVDEQRTLQAEGKSFMDHFGPLAVRIYKVSM